jgi:hypothetical protein
MTKPTLHGATYRVYVKRSDQRWQRVTTGTSHRPTAVLIGAMVGALIARREWTLLDPICRGELTLGDVWDAYRIDSKLTDYRAALDDVDLEPLVEAWAGYLLPTVPLHASHIVRAPD